MGRTISVVTPAAAVKTLCYEGSTIGELRRAIAALLHVDSSTLKLIHNGQVLVQDEAACDVHDGGAVNGCLHCIMTISSTTTHNRPCSGGQGCAQALGTRWC